MVRSIPAHAGGTARRCWNLAGASVNPRVHKRRDVTRVIAAYHQAGVSPRTRGEQGLRQRTSQRGRSIPAYTGEPLVKTADPVRAGYIPTHAGRTQSPRLSSGRSKVYPRKNSQVYSSAREGADPSIFHGFQRSAYPRVRGELSQALVRNGGRKSIPAHAEATFPRHRPRRRTTVYPRICGEKSYPAKRDAAPLGLSPRTRWVRQNLAETGGHVRYIPADTGETRRVGQRNRSCTVYPRTRGGTGRGHGSVGASQVYPRERAGKLAAYPDMYTEDGLSPRTGGASM